MKYKVLTLLLMLRDAQARGNLVFMALEREIGVIAMFDQLVRPTMYGNPAFFSPPPWFWLVKTFEPMLARFERLHWLVVIFNYTLAKYFFVESKKLIPQLSKNQNKHIMNLDDDIRIEKGADGLETYVFDPYNPLNMLISNTDIESVLRSYGVDAPIHNWELYKRAFIHRSYIRRPNLENAQNNISICPKPDDCLPLYSKSNERLEFVGDGVLECITKYYLYRRFPKENEGFMTEKKIALVKNESIGKMAYDMGLHKWFVLSKYAESKQTRTNLKKLGCLFEAFIGAMFLDFNKIQVKDEHGWFENVFVTGPGFQMVQRFVEAVFEKHVDWISLIKNDDNYKNILQVKIQKEFKVTPDYLEVEEYNGETGYHMGVYLCLGQAIHETGAGKAIGRKRFTCYQDIHQYMSLHKKILLFLGEGTHKIKKKAEQIACEDAIQYLGSFS